MSGLRVFVAVPVSGQVRQEIFALQRKLAAEAGPTIRWTKPEQIHLTLRFLGNVPDENIADLRQALDRACLGAAPIEISLSDLGCFPSRRRPRIVWLGVSNGANELTDLAERVRAETAMFGDSTDSKPFVPHLTLGRSQDPRSSDGHVGEIICRENPRQIGLLRVSEVHLVKSELSRSGSNYSIIACHPLKRK